MTNSTKNILSKLLEKNVHSSSSSILHYFPTFSRPLIGRSTGLPPLLTCTEAESNAKFNLEMDKKWRNTYFLCRTPGDKFKRKKNEEKCTSKSILI